MAAASILSGTSPTTGQLPLAPQIADGCARTNRGVTTVPASVYTDPEHWASKASKAVR